MLTNWIAILLCVRLLELYDGWRNNFVYLHHLSKCNTYQNGGHLDLYPFYTFLRQTGGFTEFSMMIYIKVLDLVWFKIGNLGICILRSEGIDISHIKWPLSLTSVIYTYFTDKLMILLNSVCYITWICQCWLIHTTVWVNNIAKFIEK